MINSNDPRVRKYREAGKWPGIVHSRLLSLLGTVGMDWAAYLESPVQEILDDLQDVNPEGYKRCMNTWDLDWLLQDTPIFEIDERF